MKKYIGLKNLVFIFMIGVQIVPFTHLSAQQSKSSLYKQTSEMADVMIQYEADRGSIIRFYSLSNRQDANYAYNSPERRQRLLKLIANYQQQILKLDFASMDINGKVDYILFKRNLEDQS